MLFSGFAIVRIAPPPRSPASTPRKPHRHAPTFPMEIRAANRQYVAVETKGGFCTQPDSILKAFIYAQSIDENEGQIKRRKSDGMREETIDV